MNLLSAMLRGAVSVLCKTRPAIRVQKSSEILERLGESLHVQGRDAFTGQHGHLFSILFHGDPSEVVPLGPHRHLVDDGVGNLATLEGTEVGETGRMGLLSALEVG